MTQISIDRKRISPPRITNINDLVQHALDHEIPEQRVISSLLLDGKEYNVIDDEQLLSLDLSSYKEIQISTVDSLDLALKSLACCNEHIDTINIHLSEVLKSFRGNSHEMAWSQFTTLIDNINLFIELVYRVQHTISKRLAKNKNAQPENSPKKRVEIEFLNVITQITKSRERNDTTMLCDLLEYDLKDNLDKWKTIVIPEISKSIEN